jgi:hypothetical protein
MDPRDKRWIIEFIVLLPIIYYIRKRTKTGAFSESGTSLKNFYTRVGISILIAVVGLVLLRLIPSGSNFVFLVMIGVIAGPIVLIYYNSKR